LRSPVRTWFPAPLPPRL